METYSSGGLYNVEFKMDYKMKTLYHNSGNFRVRKFRAKNFRVKIFSWSTMAHENILTTKKLHTQFFFRLASD